MHKKENKKGENQVTFMEYPLHVRCRAGNVYVAF